MTVMVQARMIAPMALLAAVIISCTSGKEKKEIEMEMPIVEEAVAEVDTMILCKGTFDKQLLCNGKLAAIRKSTLTVPSQGGLLEEVYVRNGSRVQKGTLLAVTDQRDRQRELEKARHDLERAKVELQDKLIGMGYDGSMADVPTEVLHRVEVTSGYYTAKYQLHSAETALEDCRLTAPFSGKVADLEARPHQRGDEFCTLIDESYFDVEFSILEAEIGHVTLGASVQVSPFINEELTLAGNITEINPTVDERGLIKVKARIKNSDSKLIDGMNVKVVVENSLKDVFVVPKDAVVERDGFHVVFLYEAGRAVWTYVDITHANLTHYVITGCQRKETTLSEGSILITSGNLNLADDTEVKAIN